MVTPPCSSSLALGGLRRGSRSSPRSLRVEERPRSSSLDPSTCLGLTSGLAREASRSTEGRGDHLAPPPVGEPRMLQPQHL